jgi:radical SAM-linked protein
LSEGLQRLRVTFSRTGDLKYLSHLDLLRLWARAIRRAELPLAYSGGFTPHPRIAFAQALPTGTTTEADLMDVVLESPLQPETFTERLNAQLPAGARVLGAAEVPYSSPSLQSQLVSATYEIIAEAEVSDQEVRATIADFLTRPVVPWLRERGGKRREFDLRAMLVDLELLGWEGGRGRLRIRLSAGQNASARPEDIVEALGLHVVPGTVHRTALAVRESAPEPAGAAVE